MPGAGRILKDSTLKVLDGGYGMFPGLELSGGKKITSVTDTEVNGHDVVTVNLEDGNTYKLSCVVSTENGTVSLTDISEYWNDVPIFEEEGS